jgi:hypothetical protein
MAGRSLVNLIGFGFQNRGCLDHSECLEQSCGSKRRTAKTPIAILADATIVDIPVAAATLRANISETPPVVLINEQGEEEKRRYEGEFFWCCVGGGRGWRGTKRRRA